MKPLRLLHIWIIQIDKTMQLLPYEHRRKDASCSFLCVKWKLVTVLLSIMFGVQADLVAKVLKLANVDIYFNTEIVSLYGRTRGTCLFACLNTVGCVYFSYQRVERRCSLHGKNAEIVPDTKGYDVYFKVFDKTGETQFDFMTGSKAFQSSTYYYSVADLSIDGNTDGRLGGLSCSHTGLEINPYWIMQLGVPGVVGKVDMYLRSDSFARNTNRSAMVSQSYGDAVSNVGIECGRYMGPLITDLHISLQSDVHCLYLVNT